MTDMAALSQDAVRQRLTRLLGAYVGQGKRYSVELLADTSENEPRTIKAYRAGETMATADKLLRILAVLPVAFAAELLAPCGLRVTRLDGDAPPPLDMNADLASLLAILAEALRDGRVDHREAPGLRTAALEMAEKLHAFGTGKLNGNGAVAPSEAP